MAMSESPPRSPTILGELMGSARIAAGETLEIRLPAILSAGYSWEAKDLPAGVTILDRSNVRTEEPDDAGRSDIQLFTLRGDDAGCYAVTFVYRRPFEQGVPPRTSVTHTIEVTPA